MKCLFITSLLIRGLSSCKTAPATPGQPARLTTPALTTASTTTTTTTTSTTTTTTTTSTTTTTTTTNITADPRLIILGGQPSSSVGQLMEIFPPSSLSIPSLPQERWAHSLTLLPGPLSRLVICGGSKTATERSCISNSGGQGAWQEYYTLKQERWYHSAARIGADSILVLGGLFSSRTAEIVPGGGEFDLQHRSYKACAIAVEDTGEVVLTGGSGDTIHGHVSRYSSNGFLGSLPDLREKRWNHACGTFKTAQGDTVLLVTGGWNGTSLLATTEILLLSSPTAWTVASALPRAVEGLTAASLPGQLYVAGGWDGTIYRDEVLRYVPEDDTWQEVGRMENGRYLFGMVGADILALSP